MARPQRGGTQPPAPREVGVWITIAQSFGALVERLGIGFSVLIVLLLTVWFMGSERTRDDFIRELLFAQITQTHHLQAFFGFLIVFTLFGVDSVLRGYRSEKAEMRRLSAEKTRLQELLARRELAHTDDVTP